MATQAVANIQRSAVNGPFTYTFVVDGSLQNAEVAIASLNAALDAVKPQIAALTGTIQGVVVSVRLT